MSDANWIRERREAWKEAWVDMHEGWYHSKHGGHSGCCHENRHHDHCSCHGGHHGYGSDCGYGYGHGGGDALYNLARFHANNIHNLVRLGSLAFGGSWGGCGPKFDWGRCGCPRCSPPPRCCDPCKCDCPCCRKKHPHDQPSPGPHEEPTPGGGRKADYVWTGPPDHSEDPVYWITLSNNFQPPQEHVPVQVDVSVGRPHHDLRGAFEVSIYRHDGDKLKRLDYAEHWLDTISRR
jgi:hypothetical protein